MKDPYEVLGVPRGADRERVKAAYRELAKKYHPDQYAGSPLADLANEKMQEINEAYDAILSGNTGASYSSSGAAYSAYDYSVAENYINRGAYDEAERILEAVSESSRDAHWYYLKGELNYRRGWTQQAYSYYSMAYNMQPGNPIYKAAFEKASQNRSGGFRTGQTQHHGSSGGCDGCDICSGLICADCCCECCGGDLIPCC
jgi:curved DNA-binding protein CbpA